jgi:hypothetical protein
MIETEYRLPRLNMTGPHSKAPRTMTPDDIPVEHPASETQRKPSGQVDVARRSVGPESEVRGGPEISDRRIADGQTPDRGLNTGRQHPAGAARERDPMQSAACGSTGNNRSREVAAGVEASDPPKPPGVPPERPDPDQPIPIEEPPGPIPVPPNDPPPPIVAASPWASAGPSP